MKTDLVVRAYAGDCLVTGVLSFEGERLTDFLAAGTAIELRHAVLVAHNDGRTVQVPTLTISREDLLAVVATNPRGSSQRRLRTQAEPVRVGIGPYEVVGYLHAPPAADPVSTALGREFVPMTHCSIGRREGGRLVLDKVETLIINRAEIIWLERAIDAGFGILRPSRTDQAADSASSRRTASPIATLPGFTTSQ